MKKYEIHLYRDVVSSILEKSILDIDLKMLIETDRELKRQQLTFDDALENPDPVHSVLQEVLGDNYCILVKLVNKEMEQIPRNPAYVKFLASMNGKFEDTETSYEHSQTLK